MIQRRSDNNSSLNDFKARRRSKRASRAGRREHRKLRLDRLEERALLAVGPQLVGVNPNGEEALQTGDRLNVAPTELTFRFNEGQQIDPTTLTGITIVRAGGDGEFTTSSIPAPIGFIGIGDYPNEVIVRFSETLVDDDYRITITGNGANPLTNLPVGATPGMAFDNDPVAVGNQDAVIDFAIDLGAKVVSIVPQPVTRGPGNVLQQNLNVIEVYFNDDELDAASATNPGFYQLLFTNETVQNTDDLRFLPQSVTYDPVANRAVLDFGAPLHTLATGTFRLRIGSDEIAPNAADPNAPATVNPGNAGTSFDTAIDVNANFDAGPALTVLQNGTDLADGTTFQITNGTGQTITFELDKIGGATGIAVPYTAGNTPNNIATSIANIVNAQPSFNVVATANGATVTFAGDTTLVLGATAPGLRIDRGVTSTIFTGVITDNTLFPLQLPGSMDEPGHRDISVPSEQHLNGDGDTSPGIPIVGYTFRDLYGYSPQGQALHNLITEAQKERAREVFELYSYYAGVQFVEYEDPGQDFFGNPNPNPPGVITVATGVLQAIDPGVVDSVIGLAGSTDIALTALMSNSVVWGDRFGESWFQTAMHEIGHLLGQGHTYDLAPLTIQGDDPSLGLGPEGIYPGDHDITHLQYLYRPESRDIDVYRFDVAEAGRYTAEIIAERANTYSYLDSLLTVYRENPNGTRDMIARNDDYFSEDSFLDLELTPGRYYVAVSASGNENFDPTIEDTGWGGKSTGAYSLRLSYHPKVNNTIVDTSGVMLDGDGDNAPGGEFNFWFQVRDPSDVLFVDKIAPGGGDGSIATPFNEIDLALLTAQPDQIVRIVGNGNAVTNPTQVAPYLIGFNPITNAVLADGDSLSVPQDVTVMIDAGAVFKMFKSSVNVGSFSPGLDASGGALQVLGTPGLKVYFTSYNDESLGQDTNPQLTQTPAAGEWGGLYFRNDLDRAEPPGTRTDYEEAGIFLNHINNADIRWGGGKVSINGIEQTVAPIKLTDARPTVSFNSITRSNFAAISANPDSFEETNFHAPRYQAVPFTSDYDRIGPDVHGNTVLNNVVNALLVRIDVTAGSELERQTVTARWNDTDIVHVLQESLLIDGTPGGPYQPVSGALTARLDASLKIDPRTIVKLDRARIETRIGANLIAEGLDGQAVVFTSIRDDRYGGSGTFDTNNDSSLPTATPAGAEDWGGLYFSPASSGSVDQVEIIYGGGSTRVGGDTRRFNAVEIHQADVRIANTEFSTNGIGTGGQAPASRFGLGTNAAGTIFVRGAQPVIIDNIIRDGAGPAININVNSLNHVFTVDTGRSSGFIDLLPGHEENQGPLLRNNRLSNNGTNGMVVRGGTLTTQSVWDDTDIVHVVLDEIMVPDFHTYGGLRLESTANESLVVKLFGQNAGFTASGRPLEIDDRIGGAIQVIGQPNTPVVLTSLEDDTVGAGFLPNGAPLVDTDNNGIIVDGTVTTLPTIPWVDNGTLISNNVADNVVGHFEVDVLAGGNVGSSGVTAQGSSTLFTNIDWVFDYLNYIDVGSNGGAINLASTTITMAPTLVSPDLVVSEGTFTGANGLVMWRMESRFDDGVARYVNTLHLSSATALGNMRFISYLDEDVEGVSDDILYQVGTPGQPDFLAYTLDGTERVGFAQGGVYQAGPELVNATYDGWAADEYFNLGAIIAGAGTTYSVTGNINTTNLPAFVDPQLGNVNGPEDITTAFAWSVNPTATSATITTFLELVPENPVVMVDNSGDWRSIRLEEFSHDRNVEVITEAERADGTAPGTNATPNVAQFIGQLAPSEYLGDENLRLGFEIHGNLNAPSDVDVYSFTARGGTEVWIDIDRTSVGLDTVVELIDDAGNVLVRSDNSLDETGNLSLIYVRPNFQGIAKPLQKSQYQVADFYSSNPLDAGFRVTLQGSSSTVATYKVRVRSSQDSPLANNDPANPMNSAANLLNGKTSGSYQLQIRLREVDEVPGSTVRYADIRNATNGIELIGLPGHSPLLGEVGESSSPNNTQATAQNIGNLLNVDRSAIAVSGSLSNFTDVDWYAFNINYLGLQGLQEVSRVAATMFDIDYADGFERPDTIISVFDATGRLVLMSRDSSIADDLPRTLSGADLNDLSRGSLGTGDPMLGTVNLPEGQYYVAVSSNSQVPQQMEQFFNPLAANPFVRLEPLNTVKRIADDAIGSGGGGTADLPEVEFLLDASVGLYAPSGVRLLDGEQFTIFPDDIFNLGLTPVTFEFDNDFSFGGVPVQFSSTDTAEDVAIAIADAINLALGPTVIATVTGTLIEFENILGITQTPAPIIPTPRLVLTKINPGVTSYHLGDVVLYVNRDLGTISSNLSTVDPYTGQVETNVATFANNRLGDLMLNDDGSIYGLSVQRQSVNGTLRFTDAASGHYLEIDPTTGVLTDLGDDGILTYEANAAGNPVRSQIINNTPLGVGVLFQATTYDLDNGNGQVLAVGHRGDYLNPPAGVDIPQNIVYLLNGTNGNPLQDPNNARIGGPATDAIEIGEILTQTFLRTQDATTFNTAVANSTNWVIQDGHTFAVSDGFNTTVFEFETGPEVRVRENPSASQTLLDGDFFILNDGISDFVYQINSGTSMSFGPGSDFVTADTAGSPITLTVTDSNGITLTFEYDSNNSVAGGNIGITVANGTNVANATATAINAQGAFTVVATAVGNQVFLTNDQGAFSGPVPTTGLTVQSDPGSAPILHVTDAGLFADQQTFSVTIAGTTTTFEFDDILIDDGVAVGNVEISFNSATATANSLAATIASSVQSNTETRTRATTDKAVINGFNVGVNLINVPGITELTVDTLVPVTANGAYYVNAAEIAAAVTNDASNAIVASADGSRINFLGAQGLVGLGTDFSGTPWFQTTGLGFLGTPGVTSGNVAVPLLAADSASAVAQSISAALTATYGASINPAVVGNAVALESTGAVAYSASVPVGSPLTIVGEGPGGIITGIAAIGTDMYAVSDRGGLWRIDNARSNPTAVYIGSSAEDLLGLQFAGLTAGPQTVEGGAYSNLLFAVTTSGNIVAFNAAGELQPIFADGATSISTGLSGARGLVFSNLDENLWSTEVARAEGVAVPIDSSRLPTTGGTSFHFGDGPTRDYNFVGGAYGSLETERFSLAGYTAADQPMLYFSYFLETEDAGNNLDSFRVFVGGDDGNWELAATNGSFVPSILDTQVAFDQSQWRQVRVPLAPFAGQENLRLRFDFTTAGTMHVGNIRTVGQELRAIDGYRLEDGDTFSIDGQVFEFERGYTINVPAGASIATGESFMVEGVQFSFGAGPGVVIPFSATDTASTVAANIEAAIEGNVPGVDAYLHSNNRLNLIGALSASESVAFPNFLVGGIGVGVGREQVNITAEMTDRQVADAIARAMARAFVFTRQIEAVDGSQIVDNSTFTVDDGNQSETFRFEAGYSLRLNAGTNLDGRQFTLTSPITSLSTTFELNDPAVDPALVNGSAVPIVIDSLSGDFSIMTLITNAINAQSIPGITATYYGPAATRDIHIGTTVVDSVAPTGSLIGFTRLGNVSTLGDVLVPYIPMTSFTSANVATAMANAINGSILSTTITATTSGRRLNLASTTDVADFSGPAFAEHSGREVIKTYRHIVRVIDHSVGDQGPLGLTTSLPGDNLINGVTDSSNARATNNAFEGVYIDNLIIGFAERGEMVTGAVPTSNYIGNPDAPGSQVVDGAYQLEIRRGAELFELNSPPLVPDPNAPPEPPLTLSASMNTNDRLVQGFTLIARAGADLIDGRTFYLHDGLRGRTFEFNDLSASNPNPGVTPGNIAINFLPSDTPATIAVRLFTAINSAYGPNFRIQAGHIVGSNRVDLFGNLGPETTGLFADEFIMFDFIGDSNLFRDQGQVLIRSNYISDSSEFGIVSEATTPRSGPLPHAGSVRNLSVLNTNNLAPGVVIQNNVVFGNTMGAIHISGDTNPAGQPVGSVPFARLINNTLVGVGGTIFGTGAGTDTGILVDTNASPTLLNNIVANFNTGISISANSSSTRVSGTLYKGNVVNATGITGTPLGDLAISLALTDPLFVDPAHNNFYLAAGSLAIDSSDADFEDRPSLVSVKSPLGLGISNILAPERDITGQLRVPDLTVSPGGAAVKIDRGAIDRSDFVGPDANLIQPLDNGVDDLDPTATNVSITEDSLPNFQIQFTDGVSGGTGIDDSTVSSAAVVISRDGATLLEGTDYSFAYNANSNTLVLTPLTGVWLPGTYVITLDNNNGTTDGVNGMRDLAGNYLRPNQVNGITQFTIDIIEPTPWTNQLNPLDVDVDGDVDVVDAVLVINTLAMRGIRPLPVPPVAPDIPLPVNPGPGIGLVDVNRDGWVSVQDALFIINFLITGVVPAPVPGDDPGSQTKSTDIVSDPVSAPLEDGPEGEPSSTKSASVAKAVTVPVESPIVVSTSTSTQDESQDDDLVEAGSYLYTSQTVVNSGGATLGTTTPASAPVVEADSVDSVYDEPESLTDDWYSDLGSDDDDAEDGYVDELDEVIGDLATSSPIGSDDEA